MPLISAVAQRRNGPAGRIVEECLVSLAKPSDSTTEHFTATLSFYLLPNWIWRALAPWPRLRLGSRLSLFLRLLSHASPWHKQFLNLRAATQAASRVRRLLARRSSLIACGMSAILAMLLLHYLPLHWLISPAAQQYEPGKGSHV